MKNSKKKFLEKACGYRSKNLKYGSDEVQAAVKEYDVKVKERAEKRPREGDRPVGLVKAMLGRNPKRKYTKGAFGSPSNPERERKLYERKLKEIEKRMAERDALIKRMSPEDQARFAADEALAAAREAEAKEAEAKPTEQEKPVE